MALLRGALIEYGAGLIGPIPNVVIFQFNPESLSRSLQIPPRPSGATQRETTQAGEKTFETISFKAHFSAANMLDEDKALARMFGIGPQLCALEKMVLPSAKLEGLIGAALDALSLCLGFFLLCLACFRAPQAPLARLFSWSPLRWLGNMSYSYYLIHGLALKAAFLAMSVLMPGAAFGSWFFWALMPVMFALTLLPSAALFLAVERPFSLAPGAPRPRDAVAPTR